MSRSESLSRVKWCRSRRGLCVFWRFAEEASRLLCLAGDDKPRQGHQSGAVESRSERQIHDPASYFRGSPPYIENDARSLGWFGRRFGTGAMFALPTHAWVTGEPLSRGRCSRQVLRTGRNGKAAGASNATSSGPGGRDNGRPKRAWRTIGAGSRSG